MKINPEMLPNLLALIPESSQIEVINNLKSSIKKNQEILGAKLFYMLSVSDTDSLLLSAYTTDKDGNLELITTTIITNIDSIIKAVEKINYSTQNLINENQSVPTRDSIEYAHSGDNTPATEGA